LVLLAPVAFKIPRTGNRICAFDVQISSTYFNTTLLGYIALISIQPDWQDLYYFNFHTNKRVMHYLMIFFLVTLLYYCLYNKAKRIKSWCDPMDQGCIWMSSFAEMNFVLVPTISTYVHLCTVNAHSFQSFLHFCSKITTWDTYKTHFSSQCYLDI